MSSIILDLPKPLQSRLEEIASRSGISVADLLIETADKISQIEELEKIKEAARKRDTRSAFEKVLAAVPDVPPIHPDDVIK